MIIKRKFITYYMPGSFFSEEQTEEVKSFDIPKSLPRDVFAFEFSETSFSVEGREQFRGKTKTQPEKHFIGQIVHRDDIPDTAENRTLRSNIEYNSPTKEAIKTHLGNWQLKEKHAVIHAPSEFKFTKPLIWKNIKSEAQPA